MTGRLCAFVSMMLMGCALLQVVAQYRARSLFIELERAQGEARQLDLEWAQLQLDQSNLAKPARIEANARRDLNMVAVSPARTQYLSGEGK